MSNTENTATQSQKKVTSYRSCFLADVQISSERIRLQDTSHTFFFIDIHEKEAVESFRAWFKKIFLKGVAQIPSIFMYEARPDGDGATDFYITKFILKNDEEKSPESV